MCVGWGGTGPRIWWRTHNDNDACGTRSTKCLRIALQQLIDEFLQRRKLLPLRNEVEFVDEIHVVLEARIEMWFRSWQGEHQGNETHQ